MSFFTRAKQKKKRRSSTHESSSSSQSTAPTSSSTSENAAASMYLGPKRRSSQDTLVFNRFDPTQEHYGQLASNLSGVNRTLNAVVRDILNADNSSPSIGPNPVRQQLRRNSAANDGYDSDDTAASIDSTLISGFKIFGRPIDDYNSKRTMPLVSLALRTGQFIFPSQQSLDHFKKSHKWRLTGPVDKRSHSTSSIGLQNRVHVRELLKLANSNTSQELGSAISDGEDAEEYEEDADLPLFHIFTPTLAQFRKKCPYMVLSKYYTASELRLRQFAKMDGATSSGEDQIKYPFCKVYDKYLKVGVKRFVLEFYPDPFNVEDTFKVVMFTHRSKPYTDSLYKQTKLRFVGTSVCTSVFGSSTIQLMVMNEPNALSLMDNITDELKPAPDNPLLKEESTLTDISGGAINYKLYGNSTLPPLAKLTDASLDPFPKKFNKLGLIYCYEPVNLRNRDELYGDYNNVKQVKLDTEVLTCMLLVLREQETKKNPRTGGSQFARGITYYNSLAPGLYGTFENHYPMGNMW